MDYDNPHIYPPAPEPVNPDTIFQIAFFATIVHEDGYVNDPHDPGGETKYGISRRSYPAIDISTLTRADARNIYYRDFWVAPKFNRLAEIAPDLAIKCFDLAVNCGVKTAVKMLQRAINTVCDFTQKPQRAAKWRQDLAALFSGKPIREDGIIGPVTLDVIRRCPHDRALQSALKGEAYLHYKRLDRPLYIAGWLNRLES